VKIKSRPDPETGRDFYITHPTRDGKVSNNESIIKKILQFYFKRGKMEGQMYKTDLPGRSIPAVEEEFDRL
jgi:hypothetical protein